MVLGILSLTIPYLGFILGIIAIVYSRKASKEIASSDQNGKGMATAGLVTGIISVSLYAIVIIFIAVIVILTTATSSTS
ncbi:MAG: DUF4190 domain-containing protein [Sporolactobacillus sp.]